MLEIALYIATPFIVLFVVIMIAVASKAHDDECVDAIYKEINNNVLSINAMVVAFNNALIEHSAEEALAYSKGFLLRSTQDIKGDKYKDKKHKIKKDSDKVVIASAYKLFAVLSDILLFLDKVNTENEIKTFNSHFGYAASAAITKGKEALALKRERK